MKSELIDPAVSLRVAKPATCILSSIVHSMYRRIDVEGIEKIPPVNYGGIIYAANHPKQIVSMTLPMLWVMADHALSLPNGEREKRFPHILAGQRASILPGYSRILSVTKQIPVDHSHGRGAFDVAKRFLESGHAIAIYPEGTTTKRLDKWPCPTIQSHEAGRKKYKTGAARMAIETSSTIVPVMQWAPPSRLRRPIVHIHFGDPIFPVQDERPLTLTGKVMLAIAEMMAKTKGEALPDDIRGQILLG